MGANSDGVSELQAFLNVHPRRLYRQGAAGSIPIKAIRAALNPQRSEAQAELLQEHVASIQATGLIQAPLGRPVPGFAHQFEVVARGGRLRGGALAGPAAT